MKQIAVMQSQIENGFTAMNDKIRTVEGRVNSANHQIEDMRSTGGMAGSGYGLGGSPHQLH